MTQENAPPVLLRNVGGNKNHFVRIDLSGYADNKTAIGVEGGDLCRTGNGRSGNWRVRRDWQTQAPPQILVGLGEADHIDLLRILLADGSAAGRDRSAAYAGDRDEGSGSARQFVPGAVCVGWAQVQARDGCDWRGGGGALVHADAAQYSELRRVDQGGWAIGWPAWMAS